MFLIGRGLKVSHFLVIHAAAYTVSSNIEDEQAGSEHRRNRYKMARLKKWLPY